jgi:hypothetical protein
VVSRGDMIGVGERVRVLEVKGNRVVVARLPAEDALAGAEKQNTDDDEMRGALEA